MSKAETHTIDRASAGTAEVDVVLPGALVTLFPGSTTHVTLQAGTVSGLLDALDVRWPRMGDRLRDERPAIRKHINIFVDGRRATLDTPLKHGTTVYVLTAMSGG
jgi:molybdopterin converting factor small subunit